MVTTDLRRRKGLCHPAVRIADDGEVVLIITEWRERVNVRQLEVLADDLGRVQELRRAPFVAARESVDLLDHDQRRLLLRHSCHGATHAPGGDHRVQIGQADAGAEPLQECPTSDVFPGYELHRLLTPHVCES